MEQLKPYPFRPLNSLSNHPLTGAADMPLILSQAEKAAALLKGSAELSFLLGAESVDTDSQAKLFHIGVTTIPKLAVLAADDGEFRTLLKDEFGLDKDADLDTRVKVGNLLIAFQRSQSRTAKESELEAEYAAKRMTRPLKTTEYGGMRAAWEARWWHLDDKVTPARSYLEERCDQLESGDFHVESLSKVINREEDQESSVQTFFDGTGKLQIRKGSTEVPLPSNPEQLRARVKLWGVGLQMIALKHTNQPALQDLNPQDVEDYLTYMLGEYVYGLTGKTATGDTVAAPSWGQLLIYEQQVRKKMYQLMTESGVKAPDALKQAFRDPVVKERHFTTPVALSATSKKPFDSYYNGKGEGKGKGNGGKNRSKSGGKGSGPRMFPYAGKGGGKGSGKGGGKPNEKGQGKVQEKGGRFGECYPYNNHWEHCSRRNCPFPHVCSRCGGRHPAYRCNNNGSGPETQGQGATAPQA